MHRVPLERDRLGDCARCLRHAARAWRTARPARPPAVPLAGPSGSSSALQREQVIAQSLVLAQSRSQPSSKRRSAQASSWPSGERRETRLQNARSSSSCSARTTSIPCGRPPRAERQRCASGRRRRRACPGELAKRDAPVAEQPQRAQQVAAAAPGRTRAPASHARSPAPRRSSSRRPAVAPSGPRFRRRR